MMLASTQYAKKLHSLSVLRWGISPAIAYTTLTSHIINMMSLPGVHNCKSISNASFLYRHRSTTGRDATGQADHGMAPRATAAATAATSARNRDELPLHAASRAGDAKKVQALLGAFTVNIHLRDADGLSALHVACEAGHLEIAKILLREGFANVDMRAGAESRGGSRFARGPGPGPAGSSPSASALAGMAPLHIACAKGNMPLVRMLLGKPNEASSDITCATRGATAFIYACMYGQLSTATSLVEEGLCRPQSRDSLGYTALHAAAESGHEAVVQYLLSLPVLWLNAQDSLGFTPLQLACQANCEAVVRMLLKEGASITHKNSAGATALLLACAGGYVNIARILVLEPGGGEMNSAEAADEDQRPMLPHFAMTTYMSKKKIEMRASRPTSNIQGLNKETSQDGANVDVKDNLGWTALHHAAAAGHIDMINVCVSELGSPVNMRTKRGEMALHLAAARGNAAAVHALVANGARVDVQHQYGRSPLHLAAANGHESVVLLLVDQCHANTNVLDDDGRTPLHDASAGGHTGAMRILLTQGRAKIGIKKAGGKTAVHLAAARGVVSALKLLVEEHKADVSDVTARGDSALHISSQFGKTACITVLIENGSDLFLRNSIGQTALDVATQAGKRTAVGLLEKAMERKRQRNN